MPSLPAQWLSLASVVIIALLALSGIHPYDRATWVMEVLPVMLALPTLWLTYRRFPLTTLLYTCLFFHAGVLILGGAYTYARAPLGGLWVSWDQHAAFLND